MKDDVAIEAIAIGASAGGMEALGVLLQALPEGFTPSILAVLHLPPDKPSLLPELLQLRCRLPVREALDKEPVQPGCVYLAPPDYHLLVEKQKSLALSRDEPVLFSRPSIDVTFESAAEAYGPALLGIVLTGANADGAEGLRAIRAAGGRAWVQSPADALSNAMPAAALERAGADLVLPLRDMAERLTHLRTGRPIAL
jgi:two-component system chemotaxis response regulator CheB